MNDCRSLAEDNAGCLRQIAALLERLADADYATGHPAAGASGSGAHLRHCLDHYDRFLAGLKSGRIDYDARARDQRTEKQRAIAQERIATIVQELLALPAHAGAITVEVKMDSGDAVGWTRSTIARELQFLLSHTVHHCALMAFILRVRGVDVDRDFGVAPSTLRNRQAQQACAQ